MTDESTCTNCGGTGAEYEGWTLTGARKKPEEFNQHRIEMEHGKDSGVMNLMPHVVSPIHFTSGGLEKCHKCHGTGKIVEFMRAEADRKAAERKERNAQGREKAKKDYPYLIMDKDAPGRVLAAKNIRIELKRAFPGHKFSVRSSVFSGGDDVSIGWTDGPTTEEVKKITDKYQEGYFDGMEDLYNYVDNPFSDVFGGAKYVMESRSNSNESYAQVAKELGYGDVTLTQYGDIEGLEREDSERVRRATWAKSFYEKPTTPPPLPETPKNTPSKGNGVIIGEYKGHAVITLPNGRKGFSFGLTKARAIIEHYEAIKKFAETG
jgi:hypothetical protein